MAIKKPVSIDFREPINANELAKYLGMKESTLEKITDSASKESFFQMLKIPKRNWKRKKEFRIVWQAHPFISDIYKAYSRRFELFARYVEPRFPHNASFGYVRGRNTIDNAKKHCLAPLILHADIKNFFPSITKERLRKLFISLGIQESTADILSEFSTIQDKLPLGLHHSPLLANLICLDLDKELQELAASLGCQYTRYADDITISGQSIPDKAEIQNILETHGFKLSEKKFRITKPGQAHYVTGLSVADSKPRAPKKMKQKLRQELYYCNKYGIEDHIDRIDTDKEYNYIQRGINRIDGMVRYISHVEQQALPHIRKDWAEMLDDQGLEVSYETISDRQKRHFNFYIDESEVTHRDQNYLAICVSQIAVEDVEKIHATTIRTHRNHISNPFAGGNKAELLKKGLHFSDSTEDLKREYIDHLSMFPCRSYIAYCKLNAAKDYSAAYISLIKAILPYRLMSCDRSFVDLFFEENSKVKKADVKGAVEEIFDTLKASKNRRPLLLDTHIAGKSEPCFSIPDYFLGVFRNYAILNSEPKMPDRKELFFEQLRDKYRVILDIDKNIVFSRKRPFLPWT